MKIHPKYIRNFEQIITFAGIWLIFGLIYVFIEYGLLGDSTHYPTTGDKYDYKTSLIFICAGSFITGLIQGAVEVLWFRRLFERNSFKAKIIFKSVFYMLFIIVFLSLNIVVVNIERYNSSLFSPFVWGRLFLFMQKFSFWSVVVYASVILDVALFYSEIRAYLGNSVLYNYSFGKYHNPKQETRIFMFLDMKSSTSIAEQIGHEKYFHLLKSYYEDMTDAILETAGVIYQYVGDEIVITWSLKDGIYKNNCIECFSKISKVLEKNKVRYEEQYGLLPEFKAGYHIGEVTIGEIGIIKKELIYTGDVLNTTARIQEECNTYNAKALISGDLLKELQKKDPITYSKIGKLTLRGKKDEIQLYSVIFS